ncbi:unnamed protein product [Brachionus calyciflorus]|uniref:Ragulator complex protein LAMTOR3 n=1 Tax=Brachionus calyciflorus TaxID=104777 RepID=A0A814QK12_9BILA|nr:unnamed protein product [Brachionus calyciflorus]
MLRPSALRQLLSQGTAGTIQATILTTRSGEYLDYVLRNDLQNQSVSSSSLNQSQKNQINVKSLCAIICSVYQSYQKLSHAFADILNYVIIDCDMYRLAIRPVGNHLICICADSNTGLGILKLKINSLADSLSSILNFAIYS